MASPLKSMSNNTIATLAQRAGPGVLNAIKTASTRTGVDFAYLLNKASVESNFDAKAKSRTSSASGLFQFIEKTWLQMVREHGDKYGMGKYAAAIDEKGHVADPALRQEILNLRNDPEKSALLAGEFAAENRQYLQAHVKGGNIGPAELYLAHFMGAGQAAAFLNAMRDNPLAAASDMFPRAASANRNVFYDAKTGTPRTLAGVYDFFAKKFGPQGTDNPAPPPPRIKPAPKPVNDIADSNAGALMNSYFLSPYGTRPEQTVTTLRRTPSPLPASPIPPRSLFTMRPEEIMVLAKLNDPERTEPRREYNP